MSEHHELSPSKYSAWDCCIKYAPMGRRSQEASAGTDAHEELHKSLTDDEFIPSNRAAQWAHDWLVAEAKGKIQSEVKLSGIIGLLGGMYGTADALWYDGDVCNIADFKTFSDGTIDHFPQLKGYAALLANVDLMPMKVRLHVLHGGIFKAETIETTFVECVTYVLNLLEKVKAGNDIPRLNKWCQYCGKVGTCMATNNALEVVHENGLQFSKLSTCQKLVVLDAVDKLSKTIREEAKAKAVENGGFIEEDGIRYEMKPWAGPSKCRDIREVASEAVNVSIDVEKKTRKGNVTQVAKGITNECLLNACTLSKSALVKAMVESNPDSNLTKADWDRWAEQFFEKTEGAPHFVRVL